MIAPDIAPVRAFLGCDTPDAWVEAALDSLDILLIDHANCEKKAASTALGMLFRYVDRPVLLTALSKLAREELRHFEQVLKVMRSRGVTYRHLSPSRYAAGLFAQVAKREPARVVDTLIVGAIIEARSCERFYRLSVRMDDDINGELGRFYADLLASEARHFRIYLGLARHCAEGPIDDRTAELLQAERALILAPDTELRFHGGPPGSTEASAIAENTPVRASR